ANTLKVGAGKTALKCSNASLKKNSRHLSGSASRQITFAAFLYSPSFYIPLSLQPLHRLLLLLAFSDHAWLADL
ncbi:MAG: hypothetical protein PHV80_06780, partial [Rugosibacter sp.]|nr:hypothetical protein [Rugosibacter sp.]